MRDPKQNESAAAEGVACNAEPLQQIKLKEMLARGDTDNDDARSRFQLNAGESKKISFFPAFLHNLGRT